MRWHVVILIGICGLASLSAAGCQRAEYPNRPITLVCPWAAGGGTDRVSRQMAAHLKQELGVPVNVINATGGKGVTGHSRGLNARPDGYTLAMITLELNMMHWSDLTRLTYHDCVPLYSVNEDYAALLVRKDAPWKTLAELEAEIREHPGELKASGTASGGAWHLALAGWLLAMGRSADDVVWVSSTGAGPSLQELVSGGLDMVCCSLPEAATLVEAGEVRALGVMSPKRAAGYEDVPTFAEQGTDWSLGGWRGLAVARGTPDNRVQILTEAIRRVVTGESTIETSINGQTVRQTFPQFMDAQGFDHTYRPPAEFQRFLAETDEKFGKLLTSDAMRSVRRDPFPPMAFPGAVFAGIVVLLAAIALQRVVGGKSADSSTAASLAETPPTAHSLRGSSRSGWINFAVVLGAVLVYVLIAEHVGFVLTVSVLLGLLLWRLGNRLWVSAVIAVVFAPLTYHLFVHGLRVPLPQGWLGW